MVVLRTDRLQLRCFTPQDAGFIVELLNDESWLRYIGDRGVRSEEDAGHWIETRLVDAYRQHGFGFWAVRLHGDAQLIGLCGLIKRDNLPEPDVGYAFVPRFRGRGYALEAVRGCLEFGQCSLGMRRILAITSPDNLASQRVLLSAGLTLSERCTLPGENHETCVYAWEAAPA